MPIRLVGMKRKILMVLTTLASIGGVFFLGAAGKYYLFYLADTDANPTRHEYLIGVALYAIISIPFWVSASVFIYPVRTLVPRSLLWVINSITGILVMAFLVVNIVPLYMVFFHK
jgi:hypothetical protein